MITRYEAALDRAIAVFAVWTLCCHATVLSGGNGYDLMVIVAVTAVAGIAWLVWRRGSGPEPVPAFPFIPDDALDTRWKLVFAALLLGLIALVVYDPDRLLVWLGCAAYCVLMAGYALARPALAAPPQHAFRVDPGNLFMFAACAFAAAITLINHRDNTDDSFYVNVAVAFADHPDWTLFGRNTLHGLEGPPPAMYHITSFELLGGLISLLTGIPALMVIHVVLGTVGGILLPIALARLFRRLDPERWQLLTLFAITFYVFDGSTQFGFSMHGFARIYQGKAIMWSVLAPVTVVYGVELGAAPSVSRAVRLLGAQVAGIGLSSTGLWMMPALACISVLVPFAWDKKSLRGAALGLASVAYPLAIALWVRSRLGGSSDVKEVAAAATVTVAKGPEFRLILQAIDRSLGPSSIAKAYSAMLLVAPLVAPNRLVRRYLIAFTVVVVALFTNPYLFDFVRKNLLGPSTYERGLWILPLPAALAFCAAAAVPRRGTARTRYAGAALGAGLLTLVYVTLPKRTNMTHPRLPIAAKVQKGPFAVTQEITELLPEGAIVVADRKVSVHLPLVHHPTMPMMAKESFFRGAERKRRIALRDAITRRLEPVKGERAAWLEAELDHYRVSGLVTTVHSERTKNLVRTIKKLGFRRAGQVDKYRIWIRDFEKREPRS